MNGNENREGKVNEHREGEVNAVAHNIHSGISCLSGDLNSVICWASVFLTGDEKGKECKTIIKPSVFL